MILVIIKTVNMNFFRIYEATCAKIGVDTNESMPKKCYCIWSRESKRTLVKHTTQRSLSVNSDLFEQTQIFLKSRLIQQRR